MECTYETSTYVAFSVADRVRADRSRCSRTKTLFRFAIGRACAMDRKRSTQCCSLATKPIRGATESADKMLINIVFVVGQPFAVTYLLIFDASQAQFAVYRAAPTKNRHLLSPRLLCFVQFSVLVDRPPSDAFNSHLFVY